MDTDTHGRQLVLGMEQLLKVVPASRSAGLENSLNPDQMGMF